MAETGFEQDYSWRGTIIHLTDLHLSGLAPGGQGRYLSPPQVEAQLQRIQSVPGIPLVRSMVAHELSAHDRLAWDELEVTLQDLVAQLEQESDFIAVAQTGDMTLAGSMDPQNTGYDAYPEVHDIHRIRDGLKAAHPGLEWLETFGNHDAWPGVVPMRPGLPYGPIETVPTFQHLFRVHPQPGVTDQVEVYRINTTEDLRATEWLAQGRARPWPASSDHPLRELAHLPAQPGVLRIAIVHHPPAYFGRISHEILTTGRFWRRDRFSAALHKAGIQLVVCGHRHALDPADVTRPSAVDQLRHQSNGLVPQVVAEAPLKRREGPPGRQRQAFSVYRLLRSSDGRSLAVDRVIFEFKRRDIGGRFVAGPLQRIYPSITLR